MRCPHCQSSRITRLKTPTELGYRRFQCRTCRRVYNERTGTPFNFLEFPTDLVCLVVLWRLRYTLSLRDVVELCLLRGVELTHETVRDWEQLRPVSHRPVEKAAAWEVRKPLACR
jgi:putative transposase